MKYAYEDLSDDQFEELIVFLCHELLGISTQAFAKGPDGGRDAKFVGTAELYPSQRAPWKGVTIVQAKHTNGYNKHFSDPDFYSKNNESTVLGKEINRIKKLRENKQLDHYMLFSNRRLAANAESEIRACLSSECDIPESSICLCGVEVIEMWLKTFPKVAERAGLDMVDSPLIVSPDDLSDVVYALAKHKKDTVEVETDPPVPRTPYEKKNKINNMSDEYAAVTRGRYLKETAQVQKFLSAPENYEILKLYEDVVDEFQLKIVAKRKDYQTFDDVMNYLVDLLFARDPVLRRNKRLTRVMLFYMYWNCDIGSDGNVKTH
ncbi:ABC-three component system protein [Alcanivorax sp. DSM 26293]|uniref:ABC-three component system protein n=1 Tax=Alcanivorax sp. DSM 26293 TaxID=1798238 RepID=UPI000CDEB80D|nr:ABC-three component system protein [Alcanivorax sp. DSM 26293]